jgi:hypothetical protein
MKAFRTHLASPTQLGHCMTYVTAAHGALTASLGVLVSAWSINEAPVLKAFPTAEGFGADAVGGRGRRTGEPNCTSARIGDPAPRLDPRMIGPAME